MKVVVLGAGVVGVTSAWYLAEAGHQVVVVDRCDGPAMETSFANGGQISADHAEPWAKPEVVPKLARWIGREDAPLLFRWRADPAQWLWSIGFLRECLPGRFERNAANLAGLASYSRSELDALVARTGIAYHRVQKGILQLWSDAADFATATRRLASKGPHGPIGRPREAKSANECKQIEPALEHAGIPIAGGVYSPRDESGDAHVFTQSLAERAMQAGVEFRYRTSVLKLETAGGRVEAVRLGSVNVERLRADAFLVALGSDSPLLLAPLGIRIPVYPLKGYSVTLSVAAAQLEPAAPTVSLGDEGGKIVISRFGDRLRAAGTAELTGYDRSVNAMRCDALHRRVLALFPQLAAAPRLSQWAGLRPATPGNVPVIGRTGYNNLYLNTGHGTLGWTLACGSARAVADLVSGRRPQAAFPFRD